MDILVSDANGHVSHMPGWGIINHEPNWAFYEVYYRWLVVSSKASIVRPAYGRGKESFKMKHEQYPKHTGKRDAHKKNKNVQKA